MRPHEHPDAADLLRTEHAVVRVLATAAGEAAAYPGLLAAIGESLGCAGSLWLPGSGDGELRCAETWPAGSAAGAELVPSAWASGVPVAVRGAFAFPLRRIGVLAFATAAPLDPDPALLATMESLGTQISQFVERCRAQQAVHAADARKSAILNAAFDCIVTMDHDGRVLEVNRAAERTFGYAAAEMVGRDLADLIIPPHLRDAHRRGLARYLRTGISMLGGHPLELEGMRYDGSEFPIEVVVTRADLPGPMLFPATCATSPRRASARRTCGAWRTSRRRCGAWRRRSPPPRTRSGCSPSSPRRSGGCSAREREHGALRRGRRGGDGRRRVERGRCPHGARRREVRIDGDTVSGRVHRTGAPARIDYTSSTASRRRTCKALGFRAPWRRRSSSTAACGGRDRLQHGADAFPAGAEQRIADFAELAAQALANAQAREELAASRARIVAAGDAERRRLERNLHDGAQQRLVSLALTLRMAARRHGEDGDLSRAGEELTLALQELRELARGIHPAVLTERGLEPAVSRLASRAPLPVEVESASPSACPARSRRPRTTSSPRR